MAQILGEYNLEASGGELPTAASFDATYDHLTNCDPHQDVAIVETLDGEPVAYARVSWEDIGPASRDLIVFGPTRPKFAGAELFIAMTTAQEAHVAARATIAGTLRYRAYAQHPGPGRPAQAQSAWLESLGYAPINFSAFLVRPRLDEIPDRRLPDGVELRPVREQDIRSIWEAHWEAFRGEWDFREATEEDFGAFAENPLRDESLWKVAWAGDTVVSQVKSFINPDENEALGVLRGYTEEISTHRDWRNRGIAGALLVLSLAELRDRGMTQAALTADTTNPGGAFHLYTSLGFELTSYEATYARSID